MKRRVDLGDCVICGVKKAATKDHIPPKGIFAPPRPDNLISVPACQDCNNGASGLDETFRAYLGLHVSRKGSEASEAFFQETLRTLEHNQSMRRKILAGIKPVYLTTPNGLIFEKAFRFLWDSDAHDAVIERTIRGLHYYHFGEILGDRASVTVHWYERLSPEILEMARRWALNKFGTGEVVYRFARWKGHRFRSMWIFQFYGAHWAGGYTTPKESNVSIATADTPKT